LSSNKSDKTTRQQEHVLKWVRKLQIDEDKALSWIKENCPEHCQDCLGTTVRSIVDGSWEHSCHYGRLFHGICHLKSELRNFLTYDGQPLVSLDIANSQPVFLSLIVLLSSQKKGSLSHFNSFNNEMATVSDELFFEVINPAISNEDLFRFFEQWEEENAEDKEDKEDKEKANSSIPLPNPFPHTLMMNLLPNYLTQDEEDYILTTEKGLLYETFLTLDNKLTRDEVKKSLFASTLYCNNQTMNNSKLGKLFKDKWPTVAETISNLKGKDHAQLPRLMQRIEAQFIYNRVVNRIALEQPDALCVTIHDSILTTPDKQQDIELIMKDEFRKIGLNPTIRTDRYGSCEAL
jgi:hypothetical protein